MIVSVSHPYSSRVSSVSHPYISRSLHVAIIDGYGWKSEDMTSFLKYFPRVVVQPKSMSFFQSMKVVELQMYRLRDVG